MNAHNNSNTITKFPVQLINQIEVFLKRRCMLQNVKIGMREKISNCCLDLKL